MLLAVKHPDFNLQYQKGAGEKWGDFIFQSGLGFNGGRVGGAESPLPPDP